MNLPAPKVAAIKSADQDFPPLNIRATARIQLHIGFTFDHIAAMTGYFAALGISHLYLSPILTARAGSTHGYDIVDPTQINPELGGEDGFRRLVQALRAEDMGLIIDIVPNHMGVGGSENPWWQHVLEWGTTSPYAHWFDINWQAQDPQLRNKVLAPFLGSSYGEALQSGELELKYIPETGRLQVNYFSHHFPIAIRDYADILQTAGGEIPTGILRPVVIRAQEIDWQLPFDKIEERADLLLQHLRNIGEIQQGAQEIAAALARFDPSTSEGRFALHRLLDKQHYRLTWWRNSADEINWRRFFEVCELAGMRIEQDDVFEATHALVFRLYGDGLIDGLRIDHIDGLADPHGYCIKLRQRLESLVAQRPSGYQTQPYLIAEKILAQHELLRPEWKLDGTTGYDFMTQVSAVLHDPQGEQALTRLWQEVTGDRYTFGQHVRSARRQLLAENLVGEFDATAKALHDIARASIETRDYSLAAIRRALREILVHFPVYRTYGTCQGRDEIDNRIFEQVAADAKHTLNSIDRPLVDLIGKWLNADMDLGGTMGALCQSAITRFQQLTPPLAAKSVEDTAFYRYGRLFSRNEVGSDPDIFSISVEDFHAACLQRQKLYPRTMIATATHDHKMGEDVRCRIAALSEIPGKWQGKALAWIGMNAGFHRTVTGEDDPNTEVDTPRHTHELMLYEMLVGAWPLKLDINDGKGLLAFAQRIDEWQIKALREAKRMSSWVQSHEIYESTCTDFLFNILNRENNSPFLQDLAAFAESVAPCGAINGLTQTLLRLTTPGIPDLYQGTEFWDLSLVDPDNRRPVDFDARKDALNSSRTLQDKIDHWQDGTIKQHIIKQGLLLRQQNPGLFIKGDYVPLEVAGTKAHHLIAFMRRHQDSIAIILATRLPHGLQDEDMSLVISPATWEDTRIVLPGFASSTFIDAISGERYSGENHRVGNATQSTADGIFYVADILKGLPLALLVNAGNA
jgi:(1->4)-alpha-D-glucan 1-alpha-D-glucosylmutase